MSTPQQGESGGGGGSFFTRKLGPLPMWGWMAIVGILVLVYAYYKKSKDASASAASTQTAATNNTPGGVDSSLVPQFINQTYTQETPPAAPNVTVNNTVPNAPPDVTNINIPAPPSVSPPSPKPPAPRPAPMASPIFNGTYKVKKGQTLAQIATQFGITREQLAHANGLGTGAGLRTGQTLKVPNPAPKGVPGPAQ